MPAETAAGAQFLRALLNSAIIDLYSCLLFKGIPRRCAAAAWRAEFSRMTSSICAPNECCFRLSSWLEAAEDSAAALRILSELATAALNASLNSAVLEAKSAVAGVCVLRMLDMARFESWRKAVVRARRCMMLVSVVMTRGKLLKSHQCARNTHTCDTEGLKPGLIVGSGHQTSSFQIERTHDKHTPWHRKTSFQK